MTDAELFSEYMKFQQDFQSKIREFRDDLNKIDHGTKKAKEHLRDVINEAEKMSSPNETIDGLNAAHILLNLDAIKKRIQFIRSTIPAGQKNSEFINKLDAEIKNIQKLETSASNVLELSSIREEAEDHIFISVESQIISKEIEVISHDLRNVSEKNPLDQKILDKITNIYDSISEKADNIINLAYGKVKEFGKKFVDSINHLLGRIKQKIKIFIKDIGQLLRNIARHFSNLLAAMVGAMFDFANWVNIIAKQKQFKINEFSIQIPSTQVKVVMIGIFPIPIPSIGTPQLSISFTPQ